MNNKGHKPWRMILCTERCLNENEQLIRKKALRDAVICIGWAKLVSVICYVLLYFMIHANNAGDLSSVLEVMTVIIIPAQIIHGVLLFMGALEGIALPLQIALWLCLLLASYNTVLGVMGFIFYIRTGSLTMHFLLAVLFLLLAMTLFTALCHDILIIYAYKKMLSDDDEFDETPSALTYKESTAA